MRNYYSSWEDRIERMFFYWGYSRNRNDDYLKKNILKRLNVHHVFMKWFGLYRSLCYNNVSNWHNGPFDLFEMLGRLQQSSNHLYELTSVEMKKTQTPITLESLARSTDNCHLLARINCRQLLIFHLQTPKELFVDAFKVSFHVQS